MPLNKICTEKSCLLGVFSPLLSGGAPQWWGFSDLNPYMTVYVGFPLAVHGLTYRNESMNREMPHDLVFS